jgi:hypothetical protein
VSASGAPSAVPSESRTVIVVRVTRSTSAARVSPEAVSASTTSGAAAPESAVRHSAALKVRRRKESPARRVHSLTRSARDAASAAARFRRRRSLRQSPIEPAMPVRSSRDSAIVSASGFGDMWWRDISG